MAEPTALPVYESLSERNGIDIWLDAGRFHLRYATRLACVAPLLVVPVISDLLQSILIRQAILTNSVLPAKAVRECFRSAWDLFIIKLGFEIVASLWCIIPFYGYIKAIDYRLRWGMASNVIAFEGLAGTAARERCRNIIDSHSQGIGVKTLVLTPLFVMISVLVIWIVCGSVYQPMYFYGFLVYVVLYLWILIPGAGAANTFIYLQLRKREGETPEIRSSAA